jgi:hypothetical protein
MKLPSPLQRSPESDDEATSSRPAGLGFGSGIGDFMSLSFQRSDAGMAGGLDRVLPQNKNGLSLSNETGGSEVEMKTDSLEEGDELSKKKSKRKGKRKQTDEYLQSGATLPITDGTVEGVLPKKRKAERKSSKFLRDVSTDTSPDGRTAGKEERKKRKKELRIKKP